MAHLHRDCTFRSDDPRCRSRMDSIAVSAARRHGLYILDHSWRVSGWTMGRQRRCFIIGPAHPSAAIGAGWLPDRTGCFRYGHRIHHDARSAVLAGRSVAVAESVVQLRPGRLPNGQDDFLTDIAVGCKFSIGNGERGHGRGGSGAALRSEEHTSELQSPCNLVCRLLLEKKKEWLAGWWNGSDCDITGGLCLLGN